MARLLRLAMAVATALVALAATTAAAGPSVIVDVDGSVESMAALATLVTHPNTASSILLVTVTGTGWGTLTVAENNVRAFLKLAGRTDIPVALGTSSTLADTPDAAAAQQDVNNPGGSCDDNRLFPPTPAMAAARGMRRSRYDEDDLYGAADALPTPSNYGTKSDMATAQLSALYNQLSSGSRVAFVATAGLATLARFMKVGNTNAVTTMLARTDVHIYENGNNLPIDPSGSALFFEKQAAVTTTLYTPSFLYPVHFTQSSWHSFSVAARMGGVKPHVAWLFSALQGRKNSIDGGVDSGSPNGEYYVSDTSLWAAFVAMAVADPETALAGKSLLTASNENKKFVQYQTTVTTVRPGLTSLTIHGNNVTRGAFLQLVPMPAAASGHVIVITEPASRLAVGQTVSMLETFWSRWRAVMLP